MANKTGRKGSAHDVGYGKPPKATQFKKGQSGNPNGRPKGSRNLSTVIQKELNTRITVTENGRQKTITKREAMGKHLVNQALRGDHKAVPVLLKADGGEGGTGSPQAIPVFEFTPEDDKVVASIVERIRSLPVLEKDAEEPRPHEGSVENDLEDKA